MGERNLERKGKENPRNQILFRYTTRFWSVYVEGWGMNRPGWPKDPAQARHLDSGWRTQMPDLVICPSSSMSISAKDDKIFWWVFKATSRGKKVSGIPLRERKHERLGGWRRRESSGESSGVDLATLQRIKVMSGNSEITLLGFESQVCHLTAVWLWASYNLSVP